MTRIDRAFVGARIHDGETLHEGAALVAGNGRFSVRPVEALPDGCPTEHLNGGIIAPRFVDLQVNGGGGVMFNDDPSVETLHRIAQSHATTGTGAILPTLITDTPIRTAGAIDAVERAIAEGVDGIAGLHLEGPHLSVARKGAHDGALIRKMEDDDLALLLHAADRIANIMVTVAPENVSTAQIRAMADAGVVVSLGHTDADMVTCLAAFDAGARCVTHLFNAMSPLGSREPGLVGAVLTRGDIYAGLIADGVHVNPTTIRVALAAKPHPERVFLVTDAMATAGSDITQFTLNGRQVYRRDNRLTLENGTLAGAHLDMSRAVSVMVHDVGETEQNAIARATSCPAALLREAGGSGRIDAAPSVVYLTERTAKVLSA